MYYKFYILYHKQFKRYFCAITHDNHLYVLTKDYKLTFITKYPPDKYWRIITRFKSYKNLKWLLNKLVKINNCIKTNNELYESTSGRVVAKNYIMCEYVWYGEYDMNSDIFNQRYLILAGADTIDDLIRLGKNISQKSINLLEKV